MTHWQRRQVVEVDLQHLHLLLEWECEQVELVQAVVRPAVAEDEPIEQQWWQELQRLNFEEEVFQRVSSVIKYC